jgi:hypothetical protein
MNTKQVLRLYLGGVEMGESTGPAVAGRELIAALGAVSRANQRYFQLCFSAMAILFVGSCVLVGRLLHDPSRLGVLFTVTGVSIAGLIATMLSLSKQKVIADIAALLAQSLQPGDVRAAIEVLFAKL